jgi:hypothetical protein
MSKNINNLFKQNNIAVNGLHEFKLLITQQAD